MFGAPESAIRTAAIAVLAATCIGASRAPAAAIHARVKETSDVYVLPPSQHARALSLGYRAALADVLWAHVMVSQGLHMQEQRRFDNLTMLLDTINDLDPTFRDPYMYADALVAIQVGATPHDDIVKAREILERGMEARPLDGDLWLTAGQFIAFIAPSSYLTDPEEQARWKVEGARILARASELSGSNSNIGWGALGGVGLLEAAGERDAAIRFLQRTLAVTDDDELKANLTQQLNQLLGARYGELYKARQAELTKLRDDELPFVTKGMFLELGPKADPAFCAGGANAGDARCALTWERWSATRNAENGF